MAVDDQVNSKDPVTITTIASLHECPVSVKYQLNRSLKSSYVSKEGTREDEEMSEEIREDREMDVEYFPESYFYEKFQAVDIPRVKVVDENDEICFIGYYMLHFNRTPAALGDEYKAEDVEHLVIRDEFSDWNMPRGIKVVKVSPPHRIEFLD